MRPGFSKIEGLSEALTIVNMGDTGKLVEEDQCLKTKHDDVEITLTVL